MIMHDMSGDKTRVPLHLEAKLSNTENVNNPTPDYLMDGDDDDLGAGLIDSVVLPRKTIISINEKILNNHNSSRIGHEEENPHDNKESMFMLLKINLFSKIKLLFRIFWKRSSCCRTKIP
jgi:hypothetical protein